MDLIETKDNINRHPWELSRCDSILREVKKYHRSGSIIDIGYGDKYFDNILLKSNCSISHLYGVDLFAKEIIKTKKASWYNNYDSIKNIRANTILMMDVLEHTKNDDKFLKDTILPLLKDDGTIILTVPAYMWLYSKHDEKLKHYRRYNIKMLKNACQKSGLKIETYHYFYSFLVPIRYLTKNKETKISTWKYSKKNIITKIIRLILNVDYQLCKLFAPISFGLSLFAVIKKAKQ